MGPNGSGKSNVVDAIRWCLGEQSVRDLRGHRSDDVIHAGRQRLLGLAEVTLTLEPDADSSTSTGELSVTRRLYRSGDSEYLVNGRKARLRDLTGALKDVQIDAGRHLVVNQGMADAWLSASPLDRRALIEQAAGLTSYRERRDEARQKMAQTERNIETVTNVLAELEPRVRLLRRQARAVEERDDAQRRLRRQLRIWYAHRWQFVSTEAAELDREASRLAAARTALSRRLAGAEAEAEIRARRHREWNERVTAAIRGLYDAERERDRASIQLESLRDQQSAALAARDDLENSLNQLRAECRSASERLDEAVASLSHIADERAGLDAESAAARTSLRESEQRVTELQRRQTDRRTQLQQAERELHRLRKRLSDLSSAQEEDARRARYTEERRNSHMSEAEIAQRDLGAAREAMESAARQHEENRSQLVGLRRSRDAAVARRERIKAILRRVTNELSDTERKLSAVQRQLQGLDLQSEGTLVGALHVREGWETAVAAALGIWAFAGVTRGEGPQLHAQQDDGFDDWRDGLTRALAGTAIWADGVVRGAPPDLANPLRCTLLVETEHEARAAWDRTAGVEAHRVSTPPLQVVTRDGYAWSPVGIQPPPRDERATQLLDLRARRDAQMRRRDLLARRRARLGAADRDAEPVIAAAAGRLASVEHETELMAVQLVRTRERARALEQRLTEHRNEAESHVERLAALERNQSQRAREITDARAQVRAAQEAVDEAAPGVENSAGELEEVERERREQRTVLDRLRVLQDAAASRQDLLDRQRASAEQEVQRSALQEKMIGERRRDLDASITDMGRRMADLQQDLLSLEQSVIGKQQAVDAVKREQPGDADLEPSLTDLRASVSSAVSKHERVLAQDARIHEEMRALAEEIQRDLGVSGPELERPVDPRPADDEIRKLRNRATQYADVDPAVVDEFRALAERQRNLEAGVSDLQGAVVHLDGIVTAADHEMRKRFDQAFDAVNDEFGRVFKIMLRGGDARLEQIQETGGIEIHAQLPGRRARSSAAFSGGERALIASALLFGVLRIRPTPFCILDEVDAALDESNVDRYLHVLRDVSRKTQVIVVTHNRATMAAADALYGLTMDRDGVSSTLSLKLDAYDAAG